MNIHQSMFESVPSKRIVIIKPPFFIISEHAVPRQQF